MNMRMALGNTKRTAGQIVIPAVIFLLGIAGSSLIAVAEEIQCPTENPDGWKCNGVLATCVGKEEGDIIKGTSGQDIIVGLEGNDDIDGKAGNDFLCGGADDLFHDGNDFILGNLGDDIILGGGLRATDTGNDRLFGGKGNDTIYGQDGKDVLGGGPDNDQLFGGEGNDTLNGNDGKDYLYGGDNNPATDLNGKDILYGNNHDDLLFGENGDDKLNGGGGNDFKDGGPGYDLCIGGSGFDSGVNCEVIRTCEKTVESCVTNTDCSPGFYCAKAEGDCNGVGNCTRQPEICPLFWDPVCGCDSNTYSNAACAAVDGENVDYRGECL